MIFSQWFFDNYEANIQMNETYKSFYGDGRDTFIRLAIKEIEKKQTNLNYYGIYDMTVTQRDTLWNGDTLGYFAVNQIYFIGRQFNKKYAFVSRHIVYENKDLIEVYNKSITAGLYW